MRRLQILMDEDLDDELERISARDGMSKSALVRDLVRKHVRRLPPLERDPIWRMAGADSFEPADVDDVLYGRVGRLGRGGRRPAARKRPKR